jgi:hypothetical protein
MRIRAVLLALVALPLAAVPAHAAGHRHHGVRAHAVKPHHQPRHATRSQAPADAGPSADDDLWATVNLCDTPDRPGAIGVRASMPPRADGATQWMRIRIQYFEDVARAWRIVQAGGDSAWDKVGGGSQLVESGYTFTFQLPAAGHRIVMRGIVDYEWRKGDAVIARHRELTELGHLDPADDQRQDSRSSCQISR